jgi:type IV pilus assembly protein PilM
VKSILNKANVNLGSLVVRRGGRPPAAIEVGPLGVVAASGKPPVFAFAPLAEGVLMPGWSEANLCNPAAVAEAIRAALGQVNPGKRAVSLVLPDSSVRVFVLDFEAFSSKVSEALPILRFRLRKMVPFDIEHAKVSYQVLTHTKEETRVLVVVLPGPVLSEYEAVVRQAGYEPGAALSSSLAALEAIHSAGSLEAVLSVHLSPQALTTCISTASDLQLYRSMELPEAAATRVVEIQRGVAVAMAYYEDKLQAAPAGLLYSGYLSVDEFRSLIEMPELAVDELVPHPQTGVASSLGQAALAGVTGAMAGAN